MVRAMTRDQSLAVIADALAHTDDATLEAAAAHLSVAARRQQPTAVDVVEAMPTDSFLPRNLTAHELALIEQSKADFREGRTYGLENANAYIEAALRKRSREAGGG
jgi:hypothetical protein